MEELQAYQFLYLAQSQGQSVKKSQTGIAYTPISVTFTPESLVAGYVFSSNMIVQIQKALSATNYNLTLYATYLVNNKPVTVSLGVIKLTVGEIAPQPTPTPTVIPVPSPTMQPIQPGVLSIILESSTIELGAEHFATIALSNSVNVKSLSVSLSSDTNIATVTPDNCTLSTLSPSCLVKLSGESVGTTQIIAAAPDYTSISANITVLPVFGYFSDEGFDTTFGTVWKCAMSVSGDLGTCNQIESLTYSNDSWNPYPVSFNIANNGNMYIYTPNYYATDNQITGIMTYEMNNNGITIDNSRIYNVGSNPSKSAVVFQKFNNTTYAYTFSANNNPERCSLSESGALINCGILVNNTVTPGPNIHTGFNNVHNVGFKEINGTIYGYFPEYDYYGVWQCPMTNDGQIANNVCSLSSSVIDALTPDITPFQISLHEYSGKLYAYIAAQADLGGFGAIMRCEINQTTGAMDQPCTELTNSTSTGFAPRAVVNIQFKSFSGSDYAYISEYGAQVWKCKMTNSGEFDGGCKALTNDGLFDNIVGGTFQTLAYYYELIK